MGASQGLGEGGVGMGSQPVSVLCFQHLLCSFDTLTRRPPADSPEDTFSLICKNQMAGHFLPRHSHGADPKDPGVTEPASEKPFKSLSFSPQLGIHRDEGLGVTEGQGLFSRSQDTISISRPHCPKGPA